MNDKEYLFQAIASLTFGSGNSFGWKKEDDNGDKIANDQRMTYENLTVYNTSKPTENEVNAKIQEIKDEETNAETKKASGKQKLKDLGLTEDEVKALIGK